MIALHGSVLRGDTSSSSPRAQIRSVVKLEVQQWVWRQVVAVCPSLREMQLPLVAPLRRLLEK
eukprot:3564925-Prorocentrum_lima.AAC.1